MKKICIAGADEETRNKLFKQLLEKYPETKSVSPLDQVVNLMMFNSSFNYEEKAKRIQEQINLYNDYTHMILFTYNAIGKDSWRLLGEDAIYERVFNMFFVHNKKVKVVFVTTPGDKLTEISAFLSGIILDHEKKG